MSDTERDRKRVIDEYSHSKGQCDKICSVCVEENKLRDRILKVIEVPHEWEQCYKEEELADKILIVIKTFKEMTDIV